MDTALDEHGLCFLLSSYRFARRFLVRGYEWLCADVEYYWLRATISQALFRIVLLLSLNTTNEHYEQVSRVLIDVLLLHFTRNAGVVSL
jgi:hypothetical protein